MTTSFCEAAELEELHKKYSKLVQEHDQPRPQLLKIDTAYIPAVVKEPSEIFPG